MLFMVIEHFRNGDARPVYRRFRDQGRLVVADVTYVSSWVSADLTRCYQIMEAPDRARLDEWTPKWADLVEFEIVPVMTSAEALAAISPSL
jgi:Domain of unknown function (DUF3303)